MVATYHLFTGVPWFEYCNCLKSLTDHISVFMTNLSATWGALSEEKKVPYARKAAEDGLRFEEEMANYVPAPQFAGGKKKKKKRVKEPGEPKRAT